ncbi:unnamed protein product, partial [Owenia fusiformis]
TFQLLRSEQHGNTLVMSSSSYDLPPTYNSDRNFSGTNNSAPPGTYTSADQMEQNTANGQSNHESPTSPRHLSFIEPNSKQDERKKILTMRYGKDQMNLIKKRLRVEFWMHEELEKLFGCKGHETYDADVDLDDILDLETDQERYQYLTKEIINTPKSSPQDIHNFITELLKKVNTL